MEYFRLDIESTIMTYSSLVNVLENVDNSLKEIHNKSTKLTEIIREMCKK